MPSSSSLTRFWSNVRVTQDCWTWTGAMNRGYGRFKSDGRFVYAHRFSYEINVGPIDQGLSLDHLCRNTACVRPDHLDPVDHRTNVLRGVGPTAMNAQKERCVKGHLLSGDNVIQRARGRRGCRECKNEYQRAKRAKETLARSGVFECPICGAGFERPKALSAHKGRRHTDVTKQPTTITDTE